MLVISIDFITGRFHATPWGRNVNEGIPEWPPSPYRVIRALIDSWKRKYSNISEARAEELFCELASESPKFCLPPVKTSFTESYLSANSKKQVSKNLVYDPFIVLNPGDSVLVGWENLSLSPALREDLKNLLSGINYLGRSESWVTMKLKESDDRIKWNCLPIANIDKTENAQKVEVANILSKREYEERKVEHSTKMGWLEALMDRTVDMFRRKNDLPPALKMENYVISSEYVKFKHSQENKETDNHITTVMFALESKVLPLMLETVVISERVHRKLMGINKKIMGDPSRVSEKFSGRDKQGNLLIGHRHVKILPLDRNNDGRIDHLMITGKEPFNTDEIKSIYAMKSIWQSDGKPDIQLIPLQWGTMEEVAGDLRSKKFRSETPFILTRHYRKGRGDFNEWLREEVKKECKNHGFPEPVSINRIDKLNRDGHSFHWIEFVRNRKNDPSRAGYGFELEFSEPVLSPISIGYGSHYGLGIFLPISGIRRNVAE